MKKVIPVILVLLIIFSCDDDENGNVINPEVVETDEEVQEVGFFNLVLGNQWTYEYFQRDFQTDNFETTNVIEERELIDIEEVNGELIYTIQVNTTGNENNSGLFPPEGISTYQVKDSLGYLVRLGEGIRYSSQSGEEYLIFSEGFGDVFGQLVDTEETVEVPAGNFDAQVNIRFALLNPDGELAPGMDNYLYADQIGEVFARISFVSDPQHFIERRLIDFDFSGQ